MSGTKDKLDHNPTAISLETRCCSRHPHMVLRFRMCPAYGYLVYEFIENGKWELRGKAFKINYFT